MPVTMEKASIEHLDKIFEIETECFGPEAFTKQQLGHMLTDPNCVHLVSRVKDRIVGFVIGRIYVEKKSATGHILTIDVSPEHRGRGLGLRLMEGIERIFKSRCVEICCLEVREDNIVALRLYERLGYRNVGRLQNYYGNAHGICLRKVLA
jgi:ribosomal-protein-alanine N-acetyltransferase